MTTVGIVMLVHTALDRAEQVARQQGADVSPELIATVANGMQRSAGAAATVQRIE